MQARNRLGLGAETPSGSAVLACFPFTTRTVAWSRRPYLQDRVTHHYRRGTCARQKQNLLPLMPSPCRKSLALTCPRHGWDVYLDPANVFKRVDNTPSGLHQLLRWLSKVDVKLCVTEATGGLERPLLTAFQCAGYSIARINPRWIRDFASPRVDGPRPTGSTQIFWHPMASPSPLSQAPSRTRKPKPSKLYVHAADSFCKCEPRSLFERSRSATR